MMKKILLTLTLLALLGNTQTALAADYTWDGGGVTNNWNDADNWSSNVVPTIGDNVILDGTPAAANYTIVVDQATATANLIRAFIASGEEVTLDIQNTGVLTFTGGSNWNQLNTNDNATLNINIDAGGVLDFRLNNTNGARACFGHASNAHGVDGGGANSTTVVDVNGTLSFGNAGEVHFGGGPGSTVEVNISSGGRLDDSNYLTYFSLGHPPVSAGNSSTTTFNQTGGDVNLILNRFTIGYAARANSYYNMTGGTMTIRTGDPNDYRGLIIGELTDSYGELNISGTSQLEINQNGGARDKDLNVGYNGEGKVLLQDSASIDVTYGRIYIGNLAGSTGTFTQQGGDVTASNDILVGYYGTGTYYLEAGSVTTPQFLVGAFNGSVGTFEMSGGTLDLSTEFRAAFGAGCTSNVRLTGGTLTTPYLRFFENSVGTATFEVDGGRLQLGNSGIAQQNGVSGDVTFNLASGTLAVAPSAAAWSSSLPATLTGDGAGNDITFEVDPAAGKLINWTGDLSGTGGLRIDNLGATAWDVTRNYSYTGDTTIVNGAIDLTNTGVNKGVLSSNRIAAMTGGTIQMANNDTTQFPTSTIALKGGTAQMDTPTAADFATPFIVEEDGGTVRSLTNDWNLSGAVTLARTTPTGGELKLAGTTNNELKGTITGDGAITKQEAGTWTLSGTNDYTGATTATAGTLAVTGTLYNGLTAGTLAVQDGGTLNFTGAGTLGLQDGSTLTLDLHQNGTFTPQAGGFGLTNLNLVLQGNKLNYNKAFIESVTASQLNSLVVAQGTPFALTIDRTGGTIAGGLTVTSSANLNPLDLTVSLTGDYANVGPYSTFDVITTGTGISSGANDWADLASSSDEISIGFFDTSGATLPSDYVLKLYYGNEALYGRFTEAVERAYGSGGNAEAMSAILSDSNPTGDTAIAQNAINSASTDEAKDQVTQQFTPSMAAAQAAAAVQTNSQLLQNIAEQIVVPWDSEYTNSMNILRANKGGYDSLTDNTNTWVQGFGYAGEQAVKDNFAGYDNSGAGIALGSDRVLGSRVVAGLAYGHTQTTLDSRPFISGSETPSNVQTSANSLVGYALFKTSCSTFLTLKAGNTWHAIDGMRRPFASDPSKIYTYTTDANTWFAQATLAWQWLQKPSFSFTPKARFAYFDYRQSAYEELRPGLASSTVDAYSNGYTQADLLFDLQVFLSERLTLNTSVGYRSLTGAEGAVLGYGADGLSYNVKGVSAAERQIVLDTGLLFAWNRRLTLITEYNYRAGDGSYLHGGTGSLVLTF